jgi:DNA-binding CsgD family transcriptional regulator
MTQLLWEDGTPRSTNNAFTRTTNSVDWSDIGSKTGPKSPKRPFDVAGTPVYLPNSHQQKAYSAAGEPSKALSKMERRTLEMYDQGDTYAEIATKLGISIKTIECYATRAIRKLGARNSRHACSILRENHLL